MGGGGVNSILMTRLLNRPSSLVHSCDISCLMPAVALVACFHTPSGMYIRIEWRQCFSSATKCVRCFAVSPLLFVFVGGLRVSGTGAENGMKE